MKTLTIKQPYAEALFHDVKKHIARKGNSKFRGWLAIHAGKTKVDKTLGLVFENMIDMANNRTLATWYDPKPPIEYQYGSIIGFVEVIDCVENKMLPVEERVMDDWTSATHMFVIGNTKRIDPVEIAGKRGLWEWTDGDNYFENTKSQLSENKNTVDEEIPEKNSDTVDS